MAGFEYVSKWPIVIQNLYLLSHAPFRFEGIKNLPESLINIYGHIHDKVELGATVDSCSSCVCVERWDYRPVDLEMIRNRIKEVNNDNKN